MSKLIRNRWLPWAVMVSGLIALGAGIHEWQEPDPLCVIDVGLDRPVSVAGDRLITLSGSAVLMDLRGVLVRQEPLRFWDLRTGQQVLSFLDDGALSWENAICSNKQRFAAEVGPDEGPRTLVFIDLAGGSKRETAVDGSCDGLLRFSPGGEFLIRIAKLSPGADIAEPRLVLEIHDWVSGKLIAQRPTLGLVSLTAVSDDTVLHFRPEKVAGKQIEVVNLRDGVPVATLPENDGAISVSSDGKYVITDRRRPDESRWTVEIRNARSSRLEASFRPEQALMRADQCFSRDGRWLANTIVMTDGAVQTELRDFPGGTLHGEPARRKALTFSPDSRLLALDEATLSVVAIPSMAPLWSMAGTRPVDGVFSHDSQTAFVLLDDPPELRCLDSASGRVKRKIPLRAQQGFTQAVFTPDQRSLLAQGMHMSREWPKWVEKIPWLAKHLAKRPNDAVVVLDADSCRIRLHLVGWNVSDAWLSVDGRTLVTTHQETETRRVLRCWDVDAWKPLGWTLGVPTGLGIGMVLIAGWRARRRCLNQACGKSDS